MKLGRVERRLRRRAARPRRATTAPPSSRVIPVVVASSPSTMRSGCVRSSSSARYVATTRVGVAATLRPSTRRTSSVALSAQCRSSRTTTSGVRPRGVPRSAPAIACAPRRSRCISEVARPDCDLEQGPQRRRRDKRIATPPEGLGVELVREAMGQSSLANPGLARHEEGRTAAPQRVGVGLMGVGERSARSSSSVVRGRAATAMDGSYAVARVVRAGGLEPDRAQVEHWEVSALLLSGRPCWRPSLRRRRRPADSSSWRARPGSASRRSCARSAALVGRRATGVVREPRTLMSLGPFFDLAAETEAGLGQGRCLGRRSSDRCSRRPRRARPSGGHGHRGRPLGG